MKNLRQKIITLLKAGYCTPQISQLAKVLHEPSTTIHYNLKNIEKDKTVIGYKAVFNYQKTDDKFCCFVLLTLSPEEYTAPERIARDLAKHPEVESVDIITGDWEIVVKIRTTDQAAYFDFVKRVLSRKGIAKIKSLMSLKQIKSEYMVGKE